MKTVDNYSNRKDRRLALKQNKVKIVGLNRPYVAPREIVKRRTGGKEVTIIERRTDKKREKIIGKESI